MPGHLTIVSGPSGCGKSSLIARLLRDNPQLLFPTSVTTRSPRAGEVDGRDYIFLTPEAFSKKVQENAFLEFASVYGKQYGTLRKTVEEGLAQGRSMLKDVDVQGALSIMSRLSGEQLTTIFVRPPSLEALEERLRGRRSEDEESFKRRLAEACRELQAEEKFSHVVVNESYELALVEMRSIIEPLLNKATNP